jgi:hypothetical protein
MPPTQFGELNSKNELQSELNNNGVELAAAMNAARKVADKGRAEPGTPQFDSLKNIIVNSNNWDVKSATLPMERQTGAAVRQFSNTYHFDFEYNFQQDQMGQYFGGG